MKAEQIEAWKPHLKEEHKSLESVEARLLQLSAKLGGAWSFQNVFGKIYFYRAISPSRLSDDLLSHTSLYRPGGIIAYKGQIQGFTHATVIREQNRGITCE